MPKIEVMEIVERLRTNWDFDNNDKLEAADEIERLRGALKTFADNVRETNAGIDKNWAETVNPLKADNERLRQQNAELIEELWGIALHSGSREANEMARAAIAKATGGE